MNVTESTVKPKNTRVAYHFERYPMDLYDAEGKARKVKSEAEEEAALALGFTENPPAIPQSIAVHAMTTQPAIQAGYDALKKELAEKVAEFNVKYATLEREYQALQKAHTELQEDYANLKVDYEVLKGGEPKPVDELLNETSTEPANPFANMQAAPKSSAAALADELKAKTKAK